MLPKLRSAIFFLWMLVTVIPIAIEWWRHRRTNAPGAEVGPQDGGPDRDITGRDID